MKKVLLLAAAILALNVVPAMAHCGACGASEAKGSMKMDKSAKLDAKVAEVTEALGLSEEQAGKMKTLIADKWEKKAAIKAEKHDKMHALKDEFKASAAEILDEGQMAKMEEMWAAKEAAKGSGKCGDCTKGSAKGKCCAGKKGSGKDDCCAGDKGSMKDAGEKMEKAVEGASDDAGKMMDDAKDSMKKGS